VHDIPPDHSGPAVAVAILALALVTGSQALYTRNYGSPRVGSPIATGYGAPQLRAYVAVSDIVYEPPIEGQAPRVIVTIQNFGATPAYKLAVAVDAQIASTSSSSVSPPAPAGPWDTFLGVLNFAITRSAHIYPGTVPADEAASARSVFVAWLHRVWSTRSAIHISPDSGFRTAPTKNSSPARRKRDRRRPAVADAGASDTRPRPSSPRFEFGRGLELRNRTPDSEAGKARSASIQTDCAIVVSKEATMLWIRIFVVTPLVLVMAVLWLSFLALQAVFAGDRRTQPAYAGDSH